MSFVFFLFQWTKQFSANPEGKLTELDECTLYEIRVD